MNRIEIILGAMLLVMCLLSVVFIFTGAVPSRDYPGRLTYGFLSDFALIFVVLSVPLGFVVMLHGVVGKRLSEAILGIFIVLWGCFASFWVGVSLYDASSPYIKGSLLNHMATTSAPFAAGIVLGIVLALDGRRQKAN